MANETRRYGPERLRVYHLALDYVERVERVLLELRLHPHQADQVLRAAESIVLNISEGAGHFSPRRKRYHYQIAYASTFETIGAVARIKRQHPDLNIVPLRRNADLICVMLRSLMRPREDAAPS